MRPRSDFVLGVETPKMHPHRKKILVVLDWYLPGCKSGGPVRTIANLIKCLGEQFAFFVLTHDRDWTDDRQYPGICPGVWTSIGGAQVCYVKHLSFRILCKAVTEVCPDLVYLNGFFAASNVRILVLRRLGLLPRVPVLLAVRNQLSPGPLHLKHRKKSLYLFFARLAGLHRGLCWQASSDAEMREVQERFEGGNIFIAPNLAFRHDLGRHQRVSKIPGHCRFACVARLSPVKNLHFTLEALQKIEGQDISFHIFGSLDGAAYWRQRCLPLVRLLSPRVVVHYHGPIENEHVEDVLSGAHFFLLPTLGENFGHAILEAFAAGCPVITSDRTPWRGLEARSAGWDLPLEDPQRWTSVLQQCVDMDGRSYDAMSRAAADFAEERLASNGAEQQTVRMLNSVLGISSLAATAELQPGTLNASTSSLSLIHI